MKKGFVLVVLSLFVFGLTSCSSDDGTNPEDIAEQFENPTGEVTNGNVTDLMNEVVTANQASNEILDFSFLTIFGVEVSRVRAVSPLGPRQQTQEELEECVTGENDDITFDMACFSELGATAGCTESGTIRYQEDGDVKTFTLNQYTRSCEDDSLSFTCDGENVIQTVDSKSISCADITCTVNGEEDTVNECFRDDEVLVQESDDTYVCLDITVDESDCLSLTSSWKDSEGDLTITCEITNPTEGCPLDTDGVQEVGSCTFERS